MLRKVSSIMRIPTQLKSTSWLISVLAHVALIIALREAYPAKTNHTNDEFKTFEFVIYQPEPDKLPQKETPKDIAKAVSKAASTVKSIAVSKQSVVSKSDIISEAKIVSQSKSVSEPEVLSSEISRNKLETLPKPKPKPNFTITAKETLQTSNPNQKTALTGANFSYLAARKPEYMDKNTFKVKATDSDKTDLDARLSSQLKKAAQQNRRLVTKSESKSPTKQMGISLNKPLAAAPDAEQTQTKIFEDKKSDNFGKINSKKTLILGLLENTADTETSLNKCRFI